MAGHLKLLRAAGVLVLLAAGVMQSAHAQTIYPQTAWNGACSTSTPFSVAYSPSAATFTCTNLLTWNSSTDVLNVGASNTPGTFSVGSLDSMTVNGIAIPVPGFALNSNIQGVIENHSYVNGSAAGGARVYLARSEGTLASPTIIANGDHLGTIYAIGYGGVPGNYLIGGYSQFLVNGTPSSTAMPTDWLLALSPAGSSTPATVIHAYQDTGVTIGAPTGGDKGAGTLNAQNLYVNGTAVSGGGGGNTTQQAVATADKSITNSNTATDDGTLDIAVAATGFYTITGSVNFAGSPSGALMGLAYTGTAIAGSWYQIICDTMTNSTTPGFSGGASISASFGATAQPTLAFNTVCLIMGTLDVSTTGTFQFGWSQLNSSATATVRKAGSWIRVEKLQ